MNDETNADAQLKSYVDRFENLMEQAERVADDTKELWQEFKSNGHDPAPMKKLLAIRKKDFEKQKAEADMIRLYASRIQFDLPF
tara:strand:- start:4439 stop:4690 length:252 start_codon:yes stop_codon:yes gene_type:complete